MIQFEPASSPFFETNKVYCNSIERQLKNIGLDCSGYCNSYGYKLETKMILNSLTFELTLHKHQSTQNGVIAPADAIDYAGAIAIMTGFRKQISVTIRESAFLRLFANRRFKQLIPAPYYYKFNSSPGPNEVKSLAHAIVKNRISYLKLSNGKFISRIHAQVADPVSLIDDLRVMTANWA